MQILSYIYHIKYDFVCAFFQCTIEWQKSMQKEPPEFANCNWCIDVIFMSSWLVLCSESQAVKNRQTYGMFLLSFYQPKCWNNYYGDCFSLQTYVSIPLIWFYVEFSLLFSLVVPLDFFLYILIYVSNFIELYTILFWI